MERSEQGSNAQGNQRSERIHQDDTQGIAVPSQARQDHNQEEQKDLCHQAEAEFHQPNLVHEPSAGPMGNDVEMIDESGAADVAMSDESGAADGSQTPQGALMLIKVTQAILE